MRHEPPLTPAQRVALERRLTVRLGWDRPLSLEGARPEARAAMEALMAQGTVARIQQLLAKGDHQAEMRLLYAIYRRVSDLLESIVLEPEFAPLFTAGELGCARRRLAKFLRGLNGPARTRPRPSPGTGVWPSRG